MSFDDDVFGPMHAIMFDVFGTDATVQRGSDEPVGVRIVVNHDQARTGDFGQVVSRAKGVDFLVAQWQPEHGDVVAWTDRLGAHTCKVDRPESDDGFVVSVVLYG